MPSKSKRDAFTAGPWRVHPYRDGRTAGPWPSPTIDVGPAGVTVAQAIGMFESTVAGPEAEANARLIAAAPAMVAALRAAAEACEAAADRLHREGLDSAGGDADAAVAAIRAAIAAAT